MKSAFWKRNANFSAFYGFLIFELKFIIDFMNDLRTEFIDALQANQKDFGIDLTEKNLDNLFEYYEFVQEHNSILHLVAPCSPEEFAVRHVLESLALFEFLPEGAKFADVGAGAGLPSIPCLIARSDLRGALIESKEKKTKFLEEALAKYGLETRASVHNKQFEELAKPDAEFVTCRALDKFTTKLPRLLKWAKGSSLLLFGGNNLREALEKSNVEFKQKLMPLSEQRFLFSARN